jgi:hypothetical protein
MEIRSMELCHADAIEIITGDFLSSNVDETSFDVAVAW